MKGKLCILKSVFLSLPLPAFLLVQRIRRYLDSRATTPISQLVRGSTFSPPHRLYMLLCNRGLQLHLFRCCPVKSNTHPQTHQAPKIHVCEHEALKFSCEERTVNGGDRSGDGDDTRLISIVLACVCGERNRVGTEHAR